MSIEKKLTLTVTEIQRFCMHDGPGLRTTVFLKGCPLRCVWCHNPETQQKQRELLFASSLCIHCQLCADSCPNNVHQFLPQHILNRQVCTGCDACIQACPTNALSIAGSDCSIDQILDILEKDRAFFESTGGITLSGGEPFAQGNAAIALLQACKDRGFSTAVETCGYFDPSWLPLAVGVTDLFLWDLKDTDNARHIRYTGVSNERIQSNLRLADRLGASIRLRCILVNGINTDDGHYLQIANTAGELSNCEGVELIPYHAYGGSKATLLGLADNGDLSLIPTAQQIDHASSILSAHGVKVL